MQDSRDDAVTLTAREGNGWIEEQDEDAWPILVSAQIRSSDWFALYEPSEGLDSFGSMR